MRLADVDTGRLLGLKYKLICCQIGGGDGRGGIREFVNDRQTSILGKGADGTGCGWVPVLHKLPDAIPNHVHRQFEMAYQLVLQS